jgi:lipopolysaccharide biosynthesis glycosyltransferase
MHIVLASDNNYAQHLGVTLLSILENAKNPENISIHILEIEINKEAREKIKSIANKYQAHLEFYSIDKNILSSFPALGHLSIATYLRLFIPQLLPNHIDKVIYLDCDLVALRDLKGLYETNLNNKALAVVEDVKSQEIARIFFYPGLNSYFNAGVMLIDLKKWREEKITQKAISFIKEHKAKLKTADQDVLNCLFKNNYTKLDRKYNTDLKHHPINALPDKDTVILHYSDKIKPWSYLYVGKNKKYYFKYLELSPWNKFKYKDKNLKNFFKKYCLALKKEAKNRLRNFIPSTILDWHKRKFLEKKR